MARAFRDMDAFLSGLPTVLVRDLMGNSPTCDVVDTKDAMLVKCELVGVKKQDLELSVEEDTLVMRGEKRQEVTEEDGEGHTLLRERSYGRFERRFNLPRGVKPEAVEAVFKDGLLEVRLPKSREAGAAFNVRVK
ncbi:Hsp20/alpha crystallin family protein [Balamuthia mandrillaris]